MKPTIQLIQNLLPTPPDGYLGYEVTQHNNLYYAVRLIHRDYDYKQGVKTIHCFISTKGNIHVPLNNQKPSNTIVGELKDLFKLNPYTTITPKYTQLKSK